MSDCHTPITCIHLRIDLMQSDLANYILLHVVSSKDISLERIRKEALLGLPTTFEHTNLRSSKLSHTQAAFGSAEVPLLRETAPALEPLARAPVLVPCPP